MYGTCLEHIHAYPDKNLHLHDRSKLESVFVQQIVELLQGLPLNLGVAESLQKPPHPPSPELAELERARESSLCEALRSLDAPYLSSYGLSAFPEGVFAATGGDGRLEKGHRVRLRPW